MIAKRTHAAFRRNDFDPVYYDFFEEVWDSGDVYADPSGWRDTEANAAGLLPRITVDHAALGRYYLDEDTTLGSLKHNILELIGFWEQRTLAWDELTLYNSVSTATSAILIALRRFGVRTIIFETPAYAVTVNQAKQSSYRTVLSPTYYDDSFRLDLDQTIETRFHPVAVWITQPRMSLGMDQDIDGIRHLLTKLSPSYRTALPFSSSEPRIAAGFENPGNTETYGSEWPSPSLRITS